MPPSAETLSKELHALKKGRGLQDPRVMDRLGPGLAEVLALDVGLSAADGRKRLRKELYDAAEQLTEVSRKVVLVALAMHPQSAPTLDERLQQSGDRLERSLRTVRRRLDDAMRELAQVLVARSSGNPYAHRGWETRSLRSVLRLDLDRPRLTEFRLVVATTQGLDHLDHRVSVPASPGHPSAPPELIAGEGCAISGPQQVSPSHWLHRIELPRPLALYEEHKYSLTCVLSSLGDLRPYYVLVPFNGGCRSFSVEVHFGTPPVAAEAWRLDGVATTVLDDAVPTAHRYDLSADPVAACTFVDVRPGLCYGVQWRWGEEPSSVG